MKALIVAVTIGSILSWIVAGVGIGKGYERCVQRRSYDATFDVFSIVASISVVDADWRGALLLLGLVALRSHNDRTLFIINSNFNLN